MSRLDRGDSNHRFRIDQRRRYLFYVEGGDYIATRLGVVNLESGRRRSYRFSPEHILALQPSFHEDTVTIAVESERGSDGSDYELLKVDAGSGRVLLRKPSETLTEKDFVAFGEPAPLDDGKNGRLTPSSPPQQTPADDGAAVEAQPVAGPPPGVRTAVLRAGRRTVAFFQTAAEPDNTVLAPDGKVYVSSRDGNDWKIEELDPSTGVRRTVAVFPGTVESMAYVGKGLAVLTRSDGAMGSRSLAMVDAVAGRVALELPWSDGESEILGADTERRVLYVRMNEGESQTCWSVRFDETALRAASAYLAAARAPEVRKLTRTDVMGLVVAGGMLLVVAALAAAAVSR